MQQLVHTGLAENRLLKACGQRHRDVLAAHADRGAPEFFNDAGRRGHPSCVAVRGDMDSRHVIRENEMFELHVVLQPIEPIRHFSEQRIRTWLNEAPSKIGAKFLAMYEVDVKGGGDRASHLRS